MNVQNTTRVSLRLKSDVYNAIKQVSADRGVDPSAFMQGVLEEAIKDHLPEERQRELEMMSALFEAAKAKAREVFNAGLFDENFTLTVFQELMKDAGTRKLYENFIEADAYENGVPKKMPLNMYLGWYIKNEIDASPQINGAGKPKRAYPRNEPIRSYTLLTMN